jgi:hypothetical protein
VQEKGVHGVKEGGCEGWGEGEKEGRVQEKGVHGVKEGGCEGWGEGGGRGVCGKGVCMGGRKEVVWGGGKCALLVSLWLQLRQWVWKAEHEVVAWVYVLRIFSCIFCFVRVLVSLWHCGICTCDGVVSDSSTRAAQRARGKGLSTGALEQLVAGGHM